MQFFERAAAYLALQVRFQELHGEAFQEFLDNVMSVIDSSYVPVRTAGRLGDMSADGLSLSKNELLACYGPEIFNLKKVSKKFDNDLSGAVSKRPDEFEKFVFVHNDLRGIHPVISSKLVAAKQKYPRYTFEQRGFAWFKRTILRMERRDVEDLLGCALPVSEIQFSMGLGELETLLEELVTNTASQDYRTRIEPVPQEKLERNRLDATAQDEIIRGLRSAYRVQDFFDSRRSATDLSDATANIRAEYEFIAQHYKDPEDILHQMQMYIAGNKVRPLREVAATWVVIAFFFERCAIFDDDPESGTSVA